MIDKAIKYYATHPYEFCIDLIKVKPTKQQKQVLKKLPKAIKERKGMAIKSGHGTGKTACECWIILWAMSCFPMPKIPCTAPTQHQLNDVLWGELKKWYEQSELKDEFVWTKTHFYNKKFPENWFAVARSSNKPENMQGFHAEFLFFVVDEAPGVENDVLEAIEGTQTQNNSIILMFGNPTTISGVFYDAFYAKRSFYYCFTFNSEKSEIVHESYYKRLEAKYGKDSDIYRVRVLGEFPKAEPDTLISLDRVERASSREVTRPEVYREVEIGIDVARYGDDETVIYSRVGDDIQLEGVYRKRGIDELTGFVIQIIKRYQNVHTVFVNVDDTGVGGGLTDNLGRAVADGIINAMIFSVNNGGSAKDNVNFYNCGAEMWNFMKEWLLVGSIPKDDDLIAQLSTRKYTINQKGKLILESKDLMKKRGLISPDRADAAVLTLRSLIYGIADTSSRSYIC